ncbi:MULTISPECIES: hypothetical protein [Actinomycetes]|uniref:hypothetical protein n=1 Tax=Actinomycetes TaxID=1760 RepID=UPI00343DC9F2
MTPELIVALIVGILTAVGGVGFWQYRIARRKEPVEQKDAAIVAAEKSQQMALANAESLRTDLAQFREDLKVERDARQKLTGRVDSLETHIREQDKTIRTLRDAVRLFTAAWDDLTSRWQHYRQSEHPPPRPNVHID